MATIRARLAGVRYVVEDFLYASGRYLRRARRGARRGLRAFWWGLDLHARRRLVAALGALAAMLAIATLAAPSLPCQLPGGGHCPPSDNARAIVPSDALAYVHVDLDPARDQLDAAGDVFARIPTISQQLAGDSLDLVPDGTGTVAELLLQVGPWVGDEAALAVLPGTRRETENLWLLAADDPSGARAFAGRATEPAEIGDYRGVEIEVHRRRDVAAALVEGFLAVGSESAVRAAIDVAAGEAGSRSLADEATAKEIRDELPPLRFADAYLSPEGAQQLADGGALAPLGPFVAAGSTRGVGVALTASDDELELAVRSALDPDRTGVQPAFFAAFSEFEPELPGRLPDDSIAYVGLGDPEATVTGLLAQAESGAPGIARGFEGLVHGLRRDRALDIEGQLLPALGEEAAFVVEPRADPDLGGIEGVPFLELVARDVDPEQAREALARLQGPVVDAIDPDFGLQAPVFTDLDIGGVQAQSLRISATIELTHAVVDDLAVIATDPQGIERLAQDEGSLEDADAFERATAGFPDSLSLLAFLDLRELVAAAERLGLAVDPTYASFADELRALHGLGLAVSYADEMLATDARLIVGEPGIQTRPGIETQPASEPEVHSGPGFDPVSIP